MGYRCEGGWSSSADVLSLWSSLILKHLCSLRKAKRAVLRHETTCWNPWHLCFYISLLQRSSPPHLHWGSIQRWENRSSMLQDKHAVNRKLSGGKWASELLGAFLCCYSQQLIWLCTNGRHSRFLTRRETPVWERDTLCPSGSRIQAELTWRVWQLDLMSALG